MIVIHGDHGVELAGQRRTNSVSHEIGPVASIPGRRARAIAGAMIRISSSPNSPPSPACGFRAATATRRPAAGHRPHAPIGQHDFRLDRILGQHTEHLPQRHVQRDVQHAQPGVPAPRAGRYRASSHDRSRHIARPRISVWPGWRQPAACSFLVQRERGDRVDAPASANWAAVTR